jgi:hypothetical protein
MKKNLQNGKYSFRKGYDMLIRKHQPLFRNELMQTLNITSRNQLYARIRGEVIPRMDEKEKIESLFFKYGVTTEIWGAE